MEPTVALLEQQLLTPGPKLFDSGADSTRPRAADGGGKRGALERAEVLVTSSFLWWTLLALFADPFNTFGDLRFVARPSGSADVVVADASLLHLLAGARCRGIKIVVLLWDGCQSYLQHKGAIDVLVSTGAQVELRVVGDSSDIAALLCAPLLCRLLYTQEEAAYGQDLFSFRKMASVSFASLRQKIVIRHRSKLISAKVCLQMTVARRWGEYRRTRFVYCGQSGILTLKAHAYHYGLNGCPAIYQTSGVDCELPFLLEWLEAVQRIRGGWERRVLGRALLRLIALRALIRARSKQIFVNLFPRNNVNVYQAGLLFRRHVFLEFGGINGDEPIYPRTADMAYLGRRVLKFDTAEAARELNGLDEWSPSARSALVARYEEQVVANFDGYASEFQEPAGLQHEITS